MDPFSFLRRQLDDLRVDPALHGALGPAEERDGRWRVAAPALGLAFVAPEDRVVSMVFVYCTPIEGFEPYGGPLPHGLKTAMSRDQVRSLLGRPERSGDASRLPVLGDKPAWDRFVVDESRLHVSYRPGSPGISMLTLMTGESAP